MEDWSNAVTGVIDKHSNDTVTTKTKTSAEIAAEKVAKIPLTSIEDVMRDSVTFK